MRGVKISLHKWSGRNISEDGSPGDIQMIVGETCEGSFFRALYVLVVGMNKSQASPIIPNLSWAVEVPPGYHRPIQ